MKRIATTAFIGAGLLLGGLAHATESILILVAPGHTGEQSVRNLGAWIESVRPEKYQIDFSADLSPNVLDSSTSLSSEQMNLLNSYDLIIMPRYGVGSSSGIASTDWNDVTTPLILMNPFMVRDETRWGWLPSDTTTPTSPAIRDLVVAENGSPYFEGIDTSTGIFQMYFFENTTMQVEVDSAILTGQVRGWTDRRENDDWTAPAEDPDATPPPLGDYREYPWLVTWDGTESSFYTGGTEAPGGHRTLLLAPLSNSPSDYRRDGLQLLVNAISMAISGEPDPGGIPDDPVADQPTAPISNAKALILTDVGEEDAAAYVDYTSLLTDHFPGMTVTRSAKFATDGAPLSETELAELAAYDLIVMPQGVAEESYNTLTWNDVTTPILNHNPVYQRRNDQVDGVGTSGWSWFHNTSTGWADIEVMRLGEWTHAIFGGVELSRTPNLSIFANAISTRRVNTTPSRILGHFLGSTSVQTTRSWITVWPGGEPFGTFDDGWTKFLPTPSAARGQFLLPDDGDVGLLTGTGTQLLLNTANWLMHQGTSRPHTRETFESYAFSGDDANIPQPNLWEELGWAGSPRLNRGSSTEGEGANSAHMSIKNEGYDHTSVWRPLHNGPRSGDPASLVDWTFKVRFNDPSLSNVSTSLALVKDTGESAGNDNMRQGIAAAIRLHQQGGSNELRYVSSAGAHTAIANAEAGAWYQVSVMLDLAEQVYQLTISNLDNNEPAQSFSAEDVPFIGSVDALDYFAIFSEDSFQELNMTIDDIIVSSRAPATEAVGFGAWRTSHFPDASGDDAISGPAADPDGDGVANLVEYLLAGDPNVASSSIRPTVDTIEDGGQIYLQMVFARDAEAGGVQATVERSDDLITWTAISGPEQAVPDNNLVRETWRDTQPVGAVSRSFLRLSAGLVE